MFKIRYCSKCVLSDNLFSVTIDNEGVCNYCKAFISEEKKTNIGREKICLKKNNKTYDVVLAYSGGKDSTYTLYLLKEKYNLNVLAVTFDNGFLAEETLNNIKSVCSNMNVDSLIVAPSTKKLNKIFKYSTEDGTLSKKSLERASAICTYCIGLVKMNIYKEAILRKIPLIAFGWTPGQISIGKQLVKLNYKTLIQNFKQLKDNIKNEFGEEYNSILLSDKLLEEQKEDIPALFYPFPNDNYNEEELIKVINKIGWKKPSDTDGNSTNCLLNSYAIEVHKEKYGFHPYALELGYLVRANLMSREEAMKRIEMNNQSNVDKVEEILSDKNNIIL